MHLNSKVLHIGKECFLFVLFFVKHWNSYRMYFPQKIEYYDVKFYFSVISLINQKQIIEHLEVMIHIPCCNDVCQIAC